MHTKSIGLTRWVLRRCQRPERLACQACHATICPLHACAQVLDIRERVLGPNHPEVAACANNLAVLLRSQGRHGEAEALYVALDRHQGARHGAHPPTGVHLPRHTRIVQRCWRCLITACDAQRSPEKHRLRTLASIMETSGLKGLVHAWASTVPCCKTLTHGSDPNLARRWPSRWQTWPR